MSDSWSSKYAGKKIGEIFKFKYDQPFMPSTFSEEANNVETAITAFRIFFNSVNEHISRQNTGSFETQISPNLGILHDADIFIDIFKHLASSVEKTGVLKTNEYQADAFHNMYWHKIGKLLGDPKIQLDTEHSTGIFKEKLKEILNILSPVNDGLIKGTILPHTDFNAINRNITGITVSKDKMTFTLTTNMNNTVGHLTKKLDGEPFINSFNVVTARDETVINISFKNKDNKWYKIISEIASPENLADKINNKPTPYAGKY